MQVTIHRYARAQEERKGAMLVFILGLLIVVLVMVVFSVDTAFMQLSRTELRAAVDAAAKAAAGELVQSNGNESQARVAGIAVAQKNLVAGAPLRLTNQDFEFGQAVKQPDGSYDFLLGAQPYTSVRVTGHKSASNIAGAVPLFFAPILGSDTFEPKHVSVASEFHQELVLAIDRSHSMAFDDTGVDWSYPPSAWANDVDGNGVIDWIDPLLSPPAQSGSRWSQLSKAVKEFMRITKLRDIPPKISLVTWSSYLGAGTTEFNLTGIEIPAVVLDAGLENANAPKTLTQSELTLLAGAGIPAANPKHADKVMANILQRGNVMMLGGTNLSSGLDQAVSVLDANATPNAKKAVILMTDGMWNTGRDPILAAQDAKAKKILVHTITFLDKADQSTMVQVAEITGGRHFHASNETELLNIFRELATTMPVALTQ